MDLATQFNPHKVAALRKASISKESCQNKIEHLDDEGSVNQHASSPATVEGSRTA